MFFSIRIVERTILCRVIYILVVGHARVGLTSLFEPAYMKPEIKKVLGSNKLDAQILYLQVHKHPPNHSPKPILSYPNLPEAPNLKEWKAKKPARSPKNLSLKPH